jgi:predicted DNA-binding transcriptional regulator YafY
MQNKEVLKQLEHAIRFTKEIKIVYQSERSNSRRNFHPYKVLFVNENFYLVGENVTKHHFEFLRISLILEVIHTKKSFHQHTDITEFIKSIQTPWASFGKEMVCVKLRVDKSIRRFFILKKYLSSQEVVKTFENGDIEVHYWVSNLREIEELVIKWLPKITIISPKGLSKMLKRSLGEKLKHLNL